MSDVGAFDHPVRMEQVAKTVLQNSLIVEQDVINSGKPMGKHLTVAIAHVASILKTPSKASFHGVGLAASKSLSYYIS